MRCFLVVSFYERGGNDVNRCWVYGNDINRCSVFGGERKNELGKFVRFFDIEDFCQGFN